MKHTKKQQNKSNNTVNQMLFPKVINIRSPVHTKKNDEVVPRKTCKKTKSEKVSNLATKSNQEIHKTNAKNKANKKFHMQCQNAKSQAKNKQVHKIDMPTRRKMLH